MADSAVCHTGMPNGSRAIITIGEVNGIIDIHETRVEFGAFATDMDANMAI